MPNGTPEIEDRVTIKPRDLKRYLPVLIGAREPALVVGKPGIGKTEIVHQVAADLERDVVVMHLAISDPTDVKGMPWVSNNGHGTEAVFVPFGEFEKLIKAEHPTVAFFDDMGQAPPAVQAGAMQMLRARRIGEHVISDEVTFVAATNEKAHRAGVHGMLEPVKSRFTTILYLDADVDDFVGWCLQRDMPPEINAFLRFKPELLSKFDATTDIKNSPSPRGWESVGKLMKLGIADYASITGAVGIGAGREFTAFVKVATKIPDPASILKNPGKAPIPPEMDVMYALCGALAHLATDKTATAIMQYARRLQPEFAVLLMRDCVAAHKGFVECKEFIAWCADNADVIV